MNAWWPLFRFQSQLANYIFGEVLLFLPIPIAITAICTLRKWFAFLIAAPALIAAIPFLAIALLFNQSSYSQIRRDGYDASIAPTSETWQGPVRARAFTLAWGFGGGFGLRVRQERFVLPGLLLVRDLYDDDYSIGGTVSFVAPGVVHVDPSSSEINPFNIRLRSFIPLLGPAPAPATSTRSYNARYFSSLVDDRQVRELIGK